MFDQPGPVSTTSQWFVLHTKARQEKALASNLASRGVEYFLPLVKHVTIQSRKRVETMLPLFPGYLFMNGSLEQAYDADRTRRVAQIIRVTDQQRIESELESLRIALEVEDTLMPCDRLRCGMWVEVRTGPFEGVRGLIERIERRTRLVLHVEGMPKAACLEIDGSMVEVIDEEALVV
ncbi:MAG: hypothetical protein GC164_02155 [Phycisphaera sp.]|nr:hypothetical protein [Phycisphaera sp.]